jgi:hypothetical protein
VDYPPEADFPNFKKMFGPRGVIHSWATEEDDPTEQPRWGRVGKQKIEDTGPLTKKRMETCDTEFLAAARTSSSAPTRRQALLRLVQHHLDALPRPPAGAVLGQAGRWQSFYHDVMVEHDKHVGQMLDLLDELGIAEDTIVVYSTDNGPHMNTWPDGAMTPFRNEKNSNWEGPSACRSWCAGRARSRRARSPTRSSATPTGCRPSGRGRRAGDQREAEEGHQAGDKHLQGPPRRLQLPALLHRPGGERAAPGDHLLLRRRRPGRAALRQLEVRLRRAARAGHGADLGGALRLPARAQDLQPAHRSLRAGGYHLQHLLGLDDRPRVPDLCRPVHRARVPGDFQEFPPRMKPASFTVDQMC